MKSSAFALLTGGVRFGAKYTTDLDKHKKKKGGVPPSTAPPPALDFFGDGGEEEATSSSGSEAEDGSSVGSSSGSEGEGAGRAPEPGAAGAGEFRRRMGIKATGSDVPLPLVSFSALVAKGLSKASRATVLRTLDGLVFKEPTPIQMQAVPSLLAGRDVVACAPTGSGKTLAFVLPLVVAMRADMDAKSGASAAPVAPRVLVLSPTRELAAQTARAAASYAAGLGIKVTMLRKSNLLGDGDKAADGGGRARRRLPLVHLLVATPLLLMQAVTEHGASLASVRHLVLDEADRLFEMGFLDQVDAILEQCNLDDLQRAMFSATMPPQVAELAATVLRDPVSITVGVNGAGASTVKQRLLFVGREEGKLVAIRQMVAEGIKPPVLLFVQSKERAKELYSELAYDGVNVEVMHSDRSHAQRDDIIRRLRRGDVWILITTDVLARGVDFKGVQTVINYDFPMSMINYVHRIGRTGRAGRTGEAITFYTETDFPMLRSLANVMKLSGSEVPEWMLGLKALPRSRRKELERIAPKRHRISTVSKFDRRKAAHKRKVVADSKAKKERKATGAGAGVEEPPAKRRAAPKAKKGKPQ